MHRGSNSLEYGEGGYSEERHHNLTASALRERQLLMEEYISQYNQVRQLMQQQQEEEGERRPGPEPLSETEHTPLHLTSKSMVQPTPEREEILEEYLRKRADREVSPGPRARQELFLSRREPGNRNAARHVSAAVSRREHSHRRESLTERDSRRQEGERKGAGLNTAVERERERYASLLQQRRPLSETQRGTNDESLSPGPPPLPGKDLLPQYRLYRSCSDMELASLADNEAPANLPGDIPNASQQLHAGSLSLPADRPAEEHSILHEIATRLSQLLHFQQQQQQQQQRQEEFIAPPTTPVPLFSGYPPSTPSLPPHHYSHYLPPPHGSTPHHIPFFSSCLHTPAPSPMPCYQSLPLYPSHYPPFPSPYPPFYPPAAPACCHQSLPVSAAPTNECLQTLPASLPFPRAPPPSAPLLLTPPLSQESRVPVAASCTQTELTFLENPLSRQLPSLPPVPLQPPREEQQRLSPRQLPVAPVAPPRVPPLPQASPLFEQVKDRIYSEVASLVSENETRPYYLMELLRAAQLLNTDYLRQAGLSSLKRVINNFLNTDRLEASAFSAFVSGGQEPPEEQGGTEEGREAVYSPTQNFPLSRHYLDTNLSGSSGDRCLSRGYPQLSRLPFGRQEGGSEISEISTSDLSGGEFPSVVSPWEQQVRVLVTRLIPLLREHLERRCEPRLLALIHCEAMCLLSELFPEEVALRVGSLLDRDLKALLSRYSSQRLRDCGEDLLVDVSELFFSQVDPSSLALSGSLPVSSGGSERESRERARDEALATVPIPDTDKPSDETFTLSEDITMDGLLIEGHKCPVPAAPLSPTLSPPRIHTISLTLSESRPLYEEAASERSEDYSHSRTVDTVSETASCTASDTSDVLPPPLPPPVPSQPPAVSAVRDSSSSPDSAELPPFANTCLSQGSFTMFPASSLSLGIIDVLSNELPSLEFTAEVVSLAPPAPIDLTGDPTAILAPQ